MCCPGKPEQEQGLGDDAGDAPVLKLRDGLAVVQSANPCGDRVQRSFGKAVLLGVGDGDQDGAYPLIGSELGEIEVEDVADGSN